MSFALRQPEPVASRNIEQTVKKKKKKKTCRDPGLFRAHANSPDLNQGPSDLQSDALPTELSRQM